jgi:hypothetical protein
MRLNKTPFISRIPVTRGYASRGPSCNALIAISQAGGQKKNAAKTTPLRHVSAALASDRLLSSHDATTI